MLGHLEVEGAGGDGMEHELTHEARHIDGKQLGGQRHDAATEVERPHRTPSP